MTKQKEFGDFQTPDYLANKVVKLVAEIHGKPQLVIEPTVGLGAFLRAATNQWGTGCKYEGYELNRDYVTRASRSLSEFDASIYHSDFFTQDWKHVLNRDEWHKVLVVGNPPWVTNSELGSLGSQNLPEKTNFQGMRGFEARTGKSNFDIAEWMLIKLVEAIPANGIIAMLCKTTTARKVLRHFWKTDGGRKGACLFHIDAKAAFDVAVDACLFIATGQVTDERTATYYTDLDTHAAATKFGFASGDLVSDIDAYCRFREYEGGSTAYKWRSGIKHDAAKIMEFEADGSKFRNGVGEVQELEGDFIYPLLKSSDLGNERVAPRKYVLVTQQRVGDDTSGIADTAPKTWAYLSAHADTLRKRKSSIYKNRPPYSIFGVGDYSFAPWKVAISGLYKSFNFVVVPPHSDRPVMIDDTCYSIPCETEAEANFLRDILSSEPAMGFLKALTFLDAKRPITIDVLRRLSLVSVARHLGKLERLQEFSQSKASGDVGEKQLTLLL